MRKIIFTAVNLLLFSVHVVNAQCSSTIPSGQSGATLTNCGVTQSITIPPTSWGTIGTLNNGWIYTITSSNGAFITVRQNDGTGTVISSGNTALTFTSNFTGTAAVMVYQTGGCTNVWNGVSSIITYSVLTPTAGTVSYSSYSCGTLTLSHSGGNGNIEWQQSLDGITWVGTGISTPTFDITSANTHRYFSVLHTTGPCSARTNIIDVNTLVGLFGIVPPYYTGNLTLTSNVTMGGNYVITGDFTVNSGVTVTEQQGCVLTVNAVNITINGTINGNARGHSGGTGGNGGNPGAVGGGSAGQGGSAGTSGSGPGGGNGGGNGTAGNNQTIDCGFICAGGRDGIWGGGGGGGAGAGGSYGGGGGAGGFGAAGAGYVGFPGGSGGSGGSPNATYGNPSNAADVTLGSGGGGAGGGGGGWQNGSAGGGGGNGGGGINLIASGSLTVASSALITVNGANGGNGGTGGANRYGGYDCSSCPTGCCGETQCRDASLCGVCTYYTLGAEGGAGGGGGGGSGGGIKLQAFGPTNIAGTLSAAGGNGGGVSTPGPAQGFCFGNARAGGAGGGGRIKIVVNPCQTNIFTATTNVSAGNPGVASNGHTTGVAGSAGTFVNNIQHPSYVPLAAGSISSSQTVNVGQTPTNLTGTAPSGGTGSYTYEWFQSTTNCGASFTSGSATPPTGWSTTGITSATFPFNNPLCQTTCFVRRVQSGNCYEWTNRVTITVNPLGTPTLSAATSVGCSGFTLNWTAVPGATHYFIDIATDAGFTNFVTGNQFFNNFNAGNVTSYPVSLLNSNTTYYVRIRAGNTTCSIISPNSSTQTITTLVTPVAVAGSNITTCTGTSPITMSGASASGSFTGIPTWSGGAGLGNWTQNANPALATFTPTVSSGNFTATLTLTGSPGCANATATRVITWGTQPTISAGPNYAGCSGTAPIPMTGAVATGTYSSATWSGGSLLGNWTQNMNPALATFTPSVASGSFTATITLTGANGCADVSATKTISWQTPISGNVITPPSVTIFCGSGNPANIVGTTPPVLTGGNGVFSYQWQTKVNNGTWTNVGGANSPDFDPPVLLADTHRYRRVVDAGLCSDTSNEVTIIIEVPISNNTITNSGPAAFCSGGDPSILNGSVPVTPVSSLTYQWQLSTDNGLTWNDISLATGQDFDPGSITQTTSFRRIVRSSSCESISNVITITIYPTATITSVTSNNISCFGGNNGSITINASGGTPPLQYSIDSGLTFSPSSVFSGLFAGTYRVAVTDLNGCVVYYPTATILSQPPLLTADATGSDASCANVFDGSITVSVSGGVGGYLYSLNGGPNQPSNTFNNVGSGFYTVQVTDANGCTATDTVTIGNQYAVTATLDSVKPISCFGGNDGEIYVTLSGGIPPYSYSINGITFQPLPYFTGLTANNYIVTLRDSKGCSAFLTVNVPQPPLLTVLIDSVKNALCNGGSTGSIFISVGGGTAPYSFNWSNGSTTQNLTNVGANTYTVTVTDSKGCTAVGGATVGEPLPLFAQVASFQNVLCHGDSSGFVDISVAGGVPPYSFNWSNGTTLEDILNVPIGTYTVTVTDKNGCTTVVTQFIDQPLPLTTSVVFNNVLCHGGTNGSIDLTVSGGTVPYNYLWSNGQTTEDINGIGAGLYTVIVTDKNGCSKTETVNITQPGAITFTVTQQNVLCHGDSTGSILVTVNGGTAPISYLWNDGNTSQNRTGLPAGTYSVSIVDFNACSASTTVTITQPPALVINETVTHVNCFGGNTGSIFITVNGGVFPYTFVWSNGATTQNIIGLTGGNYSVTVTDANGCTLVRTYNVNSPLAPIATTTLGTHLNCFGDANGTASVQVSGGTLPYSYLWSNFANTPTISGLSGGKYVVIVTDANGCTARDSVIITEPAPLFITTTVSNVLCNGGNGTIVAAVTGGTPPYNFAWSNGATSDTITVGAGTYSVTVSDNNGCSAIASATVSQPSALSVNSVVKDVSCAGAADGSITLNVFGGVGPYTFAWNNGATTQNLTGLAGNIYTVTVTDLNGCTFSSLFTVSEPTPLFSSIVKTDVNCPGAGNGTASVSVTGGTPPYTYAWSNFNISPTVTGLSGGKYFVVVRDKNNCERRDSVEILEPQPLVVTGIINHVSCHGANDGYIILNLSGGTPNYSFLWSNGDTTSAISSLAASTYTVTVSDANGCSQSASFTVSQPPLLSLSGTVINAGCFGAATGKIDVTVVGGTVPYGFAWSNGATTEDINNVPAGTYILTITDGGGCTATDTFAVTEPSTITSSVLVSNVTCAGAKNGSAILSVSGGTPPYTFLWSNFQASQNIGNLSGGVYIVIITDKNGCQHRDSAVVAEPLSLSVSVTVNQISCFNANNGSISLNVSGGTPAYSFAWSNGANTPTISGLSANNYTVTVTDAQNCTATASAQIINPSLLNINAIVKTPRCSGFTDGSIDLIVSGGTPSYAFAWSNGQTVEDLSGLASGIYIVTVTDTRGCTASDTVDVSQPSPVYQTGITTDVSCAGASDGVIINTAYGGTLPYTYQWNDGSVNKDRGNLSGGTYRVTVTDGNGCSATGVYTIFEPLPLTATLQKTDALCFGTPTATAAVVVTGGTYPYYYLWSNFSVDSAQTGLAAGIYSVIVTDKNNCRATDTIAVKEPPQIFISGVVTDAKCKGVANGAISITVSGGAGSYSFAWSNASTAQNLNNVPTGTYTVTVTDQSGCTQTATFYVGEQQQLFISIASIAQPTCYGGNNGAVDITVAGGTLPYSFAWSNGSTFEDVLNLAQGTYTVTVTDANGCTGNITAAVAQPDSLSISTHAFGSKCVNLADGKVQVKVTGGTAPYIYTLNGMVQSSNEFAGLLPGNYTLLVRDFKGCEAISSFTVTSPSQISVDLTADKLVILSGMEVQLEAVSVSSKNIVKHWWNPLNVMDFSTCSDADNCASPKATPAITTLFLVTVMDEDSCTASDTVRVEVRNAESSFIPTAFSPNGDGLNDRFEFDVLGVVSAHVKIYDRWGNLIYENVNQQNGIGNNQGWDGTFKGQPVQLDTYVYMLKLKYFNGVEKDITGTVAVMK
jgi:gliding motility-associated-like protein